MAVYMVERDLPGITNDQLAGAQRAAIASAQKSTTSGTPVRYIRSTFVPGEARCMCLFEASTPDADAALPEDPASVRVAKTPAVEADLRRRRLRGSRRGSGRAGMDT